MVAFATYPAYATNGHQMVGFGAYQNGMCGAVTAAPFDTTTALNNPAGLARLTPRGDFYGDAFLPDREVDFTRAGGSKTSGGTNMYLIPTVGWAAPLNASGTLVFGGALSNTSGMGVDYEAMNTTYLQANSAAGVNGPMMTGRIYSRYYLYKLAPALSYKVTDKLSLGVALNADYQILDLRQWFTSNDTVRYPASAGYLSAMGMNLGAGEGALGVGFSVGALYDVTDQITLGASYISKQWFQDMNYKLMSGDVTYSPGDGTLYTSRNGDYAWSGMDFPQQAAIGIAIKPIKSLVLDVDYKFINYADTYDVQSLNGTFDTMNTSTGARGTASSMPLNFGWRNVHVIAVGVQYQAMDSLWLRAGYNYGNSPIKKEDVDNNWAFPAVVEHHASVGFTAKFLKNWMIHGSYMHGFANDLTSNTNVKISLSEDIVSFGLSYAL
jgi:long-chain fatty acid transport protein